MRSPPVRRPRGIALITAMLVMALAAIAAAAVLGSANAAIRRSATLIDGERAWWYATGVESWVRSILARDRRDTQLDALLERGLAGLQHHFRHVGWGLRQLPREGARALAGKRREPVHDRADLRWERQRGVDTRRYTDAPARRERHVEGS